MRRRTDPSIKWQVIALDRNTGKVRCDPDGVSRRAAREAPHQVHVRQPDARHRRHTVVAFFGSQGLYAYDMKGTLRWKQDLGVLNAGAYDLPEYEWGNASSPIVADGRVIVQCDVHGGSFLQAFDVTTGRSLWKTARTELPSWATPTVVDGPRGKELVTNAPNFIRGYDPATGEQLWQLGGSSKITAPTPILAARPGDRRLAAVRRSGRSSRFAPAAAATSPSPSGQTTSEAIAWSKTQRGPYMPTPLAYGDQLYMLANQGLFDAYAIAGGAEVYRQRLPHAGSGFSASPVASDGRLFVSSEDGDVFVVKAGPAFELVATNTMTEPDHGHARHCRLAADRAHREAAGRHRTLHDSQSCARHPVPVEVRGHARRHVP